MTYKTEILDYIKKHPGSTGRQIIDNCIRGLKYDAAQRMLWSIAPELKEEGLIHRVGKKWFAGTVPAEQELHDTWTIFIRDESTQSITAHTHMHNAVADYRGIKGYMGYMRKQFKPADLSR